jgi:hypothetical protein
MNNKYKKLLNLTIDLGEKKEILEVYENDNHI